VHVKFNFLPPSHLMKIYELTVFEFWKLIGGNFFLLCNRKTFNGKNDIYFSLLFHIKWKQVLSTCFEYDNLSLFFFLFFFLLFYFEFFKWKQKKVKHVCACVLLGVGYIYFVQCFGYGSMMHAVCFNFVLVCLDKSTTNFRIRLNKQEKHELTISNSKKWRLDWSHCSF